MQRQFLYSLMVIPVTLILAGCPEPEGLENYSLPLPGQPASPVALALERVTTGLDRPLFMTTAPGQPGRLYIVEQGGLIRIHENGNILETPFFDLGPLIGSSVGERGLLGLAFHPAYESNGRFYVNYTNTEGTTTIALYCRYADDEYRADPATADILFTVPQPFSNHNGGMLAFGPDGYLYIASGDGGSGNDPQNYGQALDTLLGKILRIDVDGESPYAIPESNPFAGVPGARPEIWAYGLRNPWRLSFDRETGDLWIGDVGQGALEEIDFQPASSTGGENYGWRNREGSMCRPGETNCEVAGAVDPIYDYMQERSQSVTGGYVYRGSALPALNGAYFFGDYISGAVLSLTRQEGGGITVVNETDNLNDGLFTLDNIASFGEDEEGELYIVDYGAGALYRIVGE